MKPLAKLHKHPEYDDRIINTGKKTYIYGYQLEPGDEIEATDVYASTSGAWEPAPVSGIKLGDGNTVVWVRPS